MTEHGLLLRRTLESQRVKRHHNAMANQKRLETSFSSANFSLSFSHSFRCRASTHIQYNTNTMLRIFVQRRHTMTSLSLSGFSFSFTIHNVPTVRAVVGFPHLLELPVSVTTLGLFFSLSLSLFLAQYTLLRSETHVRRQEYIQPSSTDRPEDRWLLSYSSLTRGGHIEIPTDVNRTTHQHSFGRLWAEEKTWLNPP